nr:hypothetical protein [Oleomonas cavernae]
MAFARALARAGIAATIANSRGPGRWATWSPSWAPRSRPAPARPRPAPTSCWSR